MLTLFPLPTWAGLHSLGCLGTQHDIILVQHIDEIISIKLDEQEENTSETGKIYLLQRVEEKLWDDSGY